MKKETVVLYCGMGVGHLMPMIELAMLFHRHGFFTTVISADPPNKISSASNLINQQAKENHLISFHNLPAAIHRDPNRHPMDLMFEAICANNRHLYDFLTSLSNTNSIRALVVDIFCTDALEIGRQLGIPAYVHFPCAASVLAIYIHLPVFHTTTDTSFKVMECTSLDFPGVPPIPIADVPYTLQDRDTEIYQTRIEKFTQLAEADGILVNSFESLEERAVRALKDGVCLPGRKMPPVYCIGPLVKKENGKEIEERHICLTWLDSHPKGSVIFLCFGSVVALLIDQIKQIAIGLERSSQRFLWVLRSTNDENKMFEPQPDSDLHLVLPDGFLDRTKNRGMVINSWAPQVDVLNHASIGGFVSHCGWNSTLEAIIAGVPIICWPIFAEQGINKVLLTEEIKVGVVMKGCEEEFVRPEEVEEKVRWLMASEGRRVLREHISTC
ncbi:Glycosyltransferase [Rhynchospora pubera]|uniref:Glycosyltransferase n=1 Tax=Rhynchospora pubera TaxID=906938 RepID=A0AAV8GT68_9POAL|nr:Glycosyltransferase [Rhynchospora pubera]